MRKILFFAAICSALIACSKSSEDEPVAKESVTFKLSNFTSTIEPMSAPRKALIDSDDGALTDLYLFDGSTQLAHQTSDQADFGTITVMLTTGSHNLHFVATRSTGLSYSDGILACSSLRNTFGKTIVFNVSGSSEENVTLDRLSGKLVITINDEIPTGANSLRIQLGQRYTSVNVQTLFGVNAAAYDQSVSLSSRIGQSGYAITLHVLGPDADGYETTYTLTATNSSNQVIGQATGTLTLAPNTKTLLSGNLFTGTRSFVSLNTAWNADINESF